MHNTREKLIAIVAEADDTCNNTRCQDCEYIGQGCWNRMVADHLIANGVTFATDNNVGDKWIPVTERLPEKDELVLCIGKRGGMFLGEIHPFLVGRERNEVYCYVPNSSQGRYAIYWMPLPQPPKGE